MPDLYEILGLGSAATQEQVKAAFPRLAKVFHPDVNADDATSEKRFKEINHAYKILSDPGSRAIYDLGLEHKRAKGHRAMGRAIGNMAAAFLMTIGCGLYFWHVGRQLADRHAPTEVSKKYASPSPQPKTARSHGPRTWWKSASSHQRPTAEGHGAKRGLGTCRMARR